MFQAGQHDQIAHARRRRARRVDTESLLADAAQQRQRGVGHASRGGLRALRVHVHVGAKEHGFGRAGQGGAQIDEGHALRLQRPLPVVQHASHGLRGGQAAKPVGLDARFVGHRDHQQLHLPLTQLIGPVPHQAHALVEHMHAGPGRRPSR